MKSGPWHIVISMSRKWKDFWLAIGLSILAAFIFFFTAKATMHDFDYTGRIASALLHGHLGLDKRPGSWLNELVPFEGKYYSVFPSPELFPPWFLVIVPNSFLFCPFFFICGSQFPMATSRSG